MLPSVLCEHVCSLNPGEDRLAFSVEWIINDKGEILEDIKVIDKKALQKPDCFDLPTEATF